LQPKPLEKAMNYPKNKLTVGFLRDNKKRWGGWFLPAPDFY